ncbi:putative aminopeptidase W07G4.4 [Galendromus occidentalis]|uniref:Aminopeptidase W07G4.4 n=1 Tax=Galendromus occidentalis TaxID=34638 RepID=A0AAJ6QMS0_9ACAR|nr:putative aminopeptidase W07G4.4 [Galendromus occidentalis]
MLRSTTRLTAAAFTPRFLSSTQNHVALSRASISFARYLSERSNGELESQRRISRVQVVRRPTQSCRFYSTERGQMATAETLSFLKTNVRIEDGLSADYDCVVIVGTSLCPKSLGKAEIYAAALGAIEKTDESFEKTLTFIHVDGARVVYSPTGPLNRDQDDIRVFSDAAIKGVKRALSAGAKKPLVVLPKTIEPFTDFNVDAAVVLGALEAIYVPLEIREDVPEKKRKVERLGFLNFGGDAKRFQYLLSLESGRLACRDIGGSDPERMAAPKVEEYVKELFADSPVTVRVISDREQLEANYPCLAAVDRCARHVDRHGARMIFLEYSEGTPEQCLAFVGKGVTYDTGGADIKVGGIMAGMHRDKCGAAAVAGIFQTLALTKPRNIKVIGAMCMVRNSVGSDAYVADEIITSRAGLRLRVVNTDAEGRLAMADALAEMKERVIADGLEGKAHLFTIATLTGHARSAVGPPFSISLDNGPACRQEASRKLRAAGDEIGDLLEISTVRREDYDAANSTSEYEDLLQFVRKKGAPRGHQLAAAFLIRVSGLDKHGKDSSKPLAYTHLDIAAATGEFPGTPTGSPIAALVQRFIYPRI